MVVNLEFIRAIVTDQEVLVLDPLSAAVLPFIDQLKAHLFASREQQGNKLVNSESFGSTQDELPFEFIVLETALEAVCEFLVTEVKELEVKVYTALDELTQNINISNLQHVRSLKSNLTRLLARVQKVRDEMEHLLDDDEDMANLYLTRKHILSQKDDSLSFASLANSPEVSHFSSRRSSTASFAGTVDDRSVEQLEMLLEAYFVQVDSSQKKILAVREYIDDTEDFVNIQLDSQRNDLIQLQVILGAFGVGFALMAAVEGALSINIQCPLYHRQGIFAQVVTSVAATVVFVILGYARWKGHFT